MGCSPSSTATATPPAAGAGGPKERPAKKKNQMDLMRERYSKYWTLGYRRASASDDDIHLWEFLRETHPLSLYKGEETTLAAVSGDSVQMTFTGHKQPVSVTLPSGTALVVPFKSTAVKVLWSIGRFFGKAAGFINDLSGTFRFACGSMVREVKLTKDGSFICHGGALSNAIFQTDIHIHIRLDFPRPYHRIPPGLTLAAFARHLPQFSVLVSASFLRSMCFNRSQLQEFLLVLRRRLPPPLCEELRLIGFGADFSGIEALSNRCGDTFSLHPTDPLAYEVAAGVPLMAFLKHSRSALERCVQTGAPSFLGALRSALSRGPSHVNAPQVVMILNTELGCLDDPDLTTYVRELGKSVQMVMSHHVAKQPRVVTEKPWNTCLLTPYTPSFDAQSTTLFSDLSKASFVAMQQCRDVAMRRAAADASVIDFDHSRE